MGIGINKEYVPALYKYLNENEKVSYAGMQRVLGLNYCKTGVVLLILERHGIVDERQKIKKDKIHLILD